MSSSKMFGMFSLYKTGLATPTPSERKAASHKPSDSKAQIPSYFLKLPEGCPSHMNILKKLLEDVALAKTNNPDVIPPTAYELGTEAAYRSLLLRSHFEKPNKRKPIFLTDTMKLATKTFFNSKPKQARKEKLELLLGMMAINHGCDFLSSMTKLEIKKLALTNYNRIISADRISKSPIYNSILSIANSGRRNAKRDVEDPWEDYESLDEPKISKNTSH